MMPSPSTGSEANLPSAWAEFIHILRRDVVPALGCTEPMSVALAAANCRLLLGCAPEQLQVWVSGNLFKKVLRGSVGKGKLTDRDRVNW